MIVDPDFLTHWKTQMLTVELNDKAAPLYVIALWAHCQQRRTATLGKLPPNALKAICRYEGEASKLRSALERCGFLDADGESIVAHGWAEANAKLVANWENGEKGGRPKTHQKPNGNPRETQNGIGVTHSEPIEKRGVEKKEEAKASVATTRPGKPVWSPLQGWENISDEQMEEWARAFPACDIPLQLERMAIWLKANPARAKKSNWLSFVSKWLTRAQDRGGDVPAGFQGNLELSAPAPGKDPEGWRGWLAALQRPYEPWKHAMEHVRKAFEERKRAA